MEEKDNFDVGPLSVLQLLGSHAKIPIVASVLVLWLSGEPVLWRALRSQMDLGRVLQ